MSDRKVTTKKHILIEAQAGQGKSVSAAQLLAHWQAPFCWYQLGPEDNDPVFFLSTLLAALQHHLPQFRSPLLEEMLAKKEVSAGEFAHYARILLADLDVFLPHGFFLVFDDLHLLAGHDAGRRFLGNLLDHAGSRVRFMLLSRQPIQPMVPCRWPAGDLFLVDNAALALSRREVAELYTGTLQVAVATDWVGQLHAQTEGWIMGLLLAGQLVAEGFHQQNPCRISALLAGPQHGLLEYFRREILASLPYALRKVVLQLSLLDHIPTGFAEELTGSCHGTAILQDLSDRNFFLRPLGVNREGYAFHHLFRDCLRQQAVQELESAEVHQLFRRAAAWFLAHQRDEEALACCLKGDDFDSVHDILSRIGATLVSDNRIQTLKQTLEDIPEPLRNRYPWFAFLAGIVRIDTSPAAALAYFRRAMELFAVAEDSFGELLAMSQAINFHLVLDGQFNLGRPLLTRAEALFDELAPEMPLDNLIQTGHLIGAGNTFFAGNLGKAEHYSAIALNHALLNGMDNFVVALRVNRCYQRGYVGKWPDYRTEIERALPLMNSPRVSAIHKMSLWVAMVNLLVMEGDFVNYEAWKTKFPPTVPEELFAQSMAAPLVLAWDIDSRIAQGDYEEAMASVKKGIASVYAGANAHLRSQFFLYYAFLAALGGEREEAVAAAEESARLRSAVGGEFFLISNSMVIGGAYAILGMTEEAEKVLTPAIARSISLGEEFLRAGAHAHRAFARLGGGQDAAALADIRSALRCLKNNRYVHFFCWSPLVMERILSVAAQENIERKYAQHLGRERLGKVFLDSGEALPLLRIKTLGGLALELPGAGTVRDVDLTPTMRELLAVLIALPGNRISLDEAQVQLWPDHLDEPAGEEQEFFASSKTAAKTRSKLDNLTARLRQVFKKAFEPYAEKNYFVVEKGILRLRHCTVDATEFVRYAEQGLVHFRRKEFWQAGNAFGRAHRLWQGEFLPGMHGQEGVAVMHHRLLDLHVESILAWQAILLRTGQTDTAIRVVNEACGLAPLNRDLLRVLYDLHAQNGDAVQSRQVLQRYELNLRQEGFEPEEIDELLDGFWALRPFN